MQLESALDGMPENGTLFLDMSRKPLNNSWQQGKTDNILRSYHTFTKYPKGSFPVLHLTKLSLFSNLSIASQHVKSPWMSSIEQIPEHCISDPFCVVE